MQALFSVGTVILYVVDSYIWGEAYHSTSMKVEVRSQAVPGVPACHYLCSRSY